MRVKLTDRIVRAAKAKPGERIELRDAVVPGLALRVTGKGKRTEGTKSWSYVYKRPGTKEQHRVTIGTYPEISLKEARDGRPEQDDGPKVVGARQLRAEVKAGGHPAGGVATFRAEMTFEKLGAFYIEGHAKKKKRSWARDLRRLETKVYPPIGHLKVSLVTKSDIADVLEAVEGESGPSEANRVFSLLRKVFNYGIAKEHAPHNPCLGIEKPADEISRERVLDDAEIKVMWNGLDTARMGWNARQIIKLCLVTGQRRGEVCGMPKAELELTPPNWVIPKALKRGLSEALQREITNMAWWQLPGGGRTKNGKPHLVPLSTMAVDLIAEALERSGDSLYVFPGVAKALGAHVHVDTSTVSRAVSDNQEHFGLEHWSLHDLRRTMTTNLAALGYSRFIQDRITNHVTGHGGVGGIYDRHDYLTEKCLAMRDWALTLQDLIAVDDGASKVVQFRPPG